MNFGDSNRKNKFYYGKEGNSTVNQENFWKKATKREWKITGAKEQGYAGEIDQRKIDQMRAFLYHRGASRGSSRVRGSDVDQNRRPSSRESRASFRTGLTDLTRATGWESRATGASTESSKLLQELIMSNLALKKEFGSLKDEMLRTNNRLAQMEPSATGRGSRLSTGRTRTPMLPN